MGNRKTHKGNYKPINRDKYRGDIQNIFYRSGWERRVMVFLDTNSNVLSWTSENVIVPYWSPVDQKWHRYFPDFVVVMRTRDGSVRTVMIEVKPEHQCVPPVMGKRRTRKFMVESATYEINQAKWKAARAYCEAKGWDFMVMTEKHLGLKKN